MDDLRLQTLRSTIQDSLQEIVQLRHELHAHPEIRFEEEWTADRICRFLEEEGVSFTRGHAKGTGIVATVTGEGAGVVALRSDMDALEIEERSGLPYASTIPERMHACGHDGHMANLCGTIRALNRHRDWLRGTVKCIFQPAEENAGGGRFIVEEGLLDDVHAVFGLHGWPVLSVGSVGVLSGPAMASADFFRIEVVGKGAHGADPGSGVDPIVVCGHILTALQSIVSREVDPWRSAVITVARIDAGHAVNVIPECAEMEGTFRAMDPRVRDHLYEASPRIATHVAQAHRAEAHITFPGTPYPVLVNDPDMSAFMKETIREQWGAGALIEPENPTMGAEDFAFYLNRCPGAYAWLGVNPSHGKPYPPLHSPYYDYTDEALPVGIEFMSALAIRFLESRSN